MYCKNCGKQLPDNSKFCDACGTAMNVGPSVNTVAAIPVTSPTINHSEAEIARAAAEVARAGAEVARAKVDMTRATTEPATSVISPKSRLAATLLAFFLGIFGAHRFYLGKPGSAAGMLVLTIISFIIVAKTTGSLLGFWLGLGLGAGLGLGLQPNLDLMNLGALGIAFVIALILLFAVGLWAFIDFIVAVSGHMKDGQGRRVKKWR